eukprot:1657083-Amphidinium_carterae.1
MSQGLYLIDAAAARARRHNDETSKGLAEVQADLDRLTKKVQAARESRQSAASRNAGRISIPASLAPEPAATRLPVRYSPHDAPRRQLSKSPCETAGDYSHSSQKQSAEKAPSRSGSKSDHKPPPLQQTQDASCARSAHSYFSFGGVGAAGTKTPTQARSGRPPNNPSAPLGQKVPDIGNAVLDDVKREMLAAQSSSKAEQRALVKRLMVKWHPDRNPGSIDVATAVFQYIQQEKSSLLGL